MGTFVDPEVIHPHIAMHPADNYYNTDNLGGREGATTGCGTGVGVQV